MATKNKESECHDEKYHQKEKPKLPIRSCEIETSQPIKGKTSGKVPSWLKGCLIRNGSGKFQIGPDTYKHTFDGLALMHRFGIENGNVTYQNSFVRSDAYNKNTAANRIVVSEFGTTAFPDPCKTIYQRLMTHFFPDITDNDNVNLFKIGDQYYVGTEAQCIHRINIDSLETKERIDVTKCVAVNSATAHPHSEPDGTLINLGSSFSLGGSKYCIIKFPPKTDEKSSFDSASIVCSIPSSRLLYPSYFHSFALTENYYIIIEQSVNISLPRFGSSYLYRKSFADCLVWCPEQMTRFHIAKKSSGEVLPLKRLAKPFFFFHTINAYEEDNHIVVDICTFKDMEIIKALYLSEMEKNKLDNVLSAGTSVSSEARRYILPLSNDSFLKMKDTNKELTFPKSKASAILQDDNSVLCLHEHLCEDGFAMELPRINYKANGKMYKYFYGVCRENNASTISIMKADVISKKQVFWKEEGKLPSEPVFVASPDGTDEDDGVILSSLLHCDDDSKVTLLIINAKTFQEISRVEFTTKSTVPTDFHGLFIS